MTGESEPLARRGALPYRTKQAFVYETLRDAIMRCEMRPGQRLVIDELARRLEVSAIPVREALQILQSEGLVDNVPHVGATVSAISRESIDEVFSIMEGLEIVATRSTAQRMTAEDAGLLEEIAAAMDAALAAERNEEWADLNSRFHLTISRLSAMPMLHEMTERALSRWDRVRRFYFNGVLLHRMEQAQEEHRALLRAMKAKDLAKLEATVRLHNQGALLAYSEYLQARAV
jgi:DNA-binding GntR family transcriptional regulator